MVHGPAQEFAVNAQVATLGGVPTREWGATASRARPLLGGLLALCGFTLLSAGLAVRDAVPIPARAAGWTSASPMPQAVGLDRGLQPRSTSGADQPSARMAVPARQAVDLPLASAHDARLALYEMAAAQRGWPRRVSCKSTIEGFSPCSPPQAGSEDRLARALFGPPHVGRNTVSHQGQPSVVEQEDSP